MSAPRTFLLEETDSRATITLNRPETRNAMSSELLRELTSEMKRLAESDSLRVVVITSAGGKSFASGMDLHELAAMTPREAQLHFDELDACLQSIEAVPVPVIAAIEGYALGGGCELASACDLRIAESSAVFGIPIGRFGHSPDRKNIARLIRVVPPDSVKAMVYTDMLMSAQEMRETGFLNWVVPNPGFRDFVESIARKIERQSPLGIRAIKRTIEEAEQGIVEHHEDPNVDAVTSLWSTSDFQEGVAAFFEKRTPRFEGK